MFIIVKLYPVLQKLQNKASRSQQNVEEGSFAVHERFVFVLAILQIGIIFCTYILFHFDLCHRNILWPILQLISNDCCIWLFGFTSKLIIRINEKRFYINNESKFHFHTYNYRYVSGIFHPFIKKNERTSIFYLMFKNFSIEFLCSSCITYEIF